jgi:3-hydroxyisobutyrate dehydrogenase-like beta-hydroxyacid dehydrogenase
MTDRIERVGCIGLGRMGAGIAHNVQRAGFQVVVYNRTADKAAALVRAGATLARSPREAATGVQAVITSLMDDRSVLDTLGGADGILAGLPRGALHVGATTVSPRCARQVAAMHEAHGSHFVAAPVLGRPDVAEAGQLRAFVAGDPGAIARCEPLLAAYTAGVVDLGPEQAVASSLKLAVNYILAVNIELMGQVYAFGEKSGIDADVLGTVMATLFASPALPGYSQRIRTRNFDDVGFALPGGLKDADLFLDASADARAPLPFAAVVHDRLVTALARGLEHKDWSAVTEIARQNAGLD